VLLYKIIPSNCVPNTAGAAPQ